MKNVIVSYEVAKLAKEIGFNKKVQLFYIIEDEYLSNPLDKNNSFICNIRKDNFNRQNHLYSAPKQKELIKWLKKNFNIVICIKPVLAYNDGLYYSPFFINIISKQSSEKSRNEDTIYNTYYEAVNKILEEALKQINHDNINRTSE